MSFTERMPSPATYGDTTPRTFTLDPSWSDTYNVVQPAIANVYTFDLPNVASVQGSGSYSGNRLEFVIKNEQPGAQVIVVPQGSFAGPGSTNWSGDTIEGNPFQVSIAGDEALHLFSDVPGVSPSDWKPFNPRPHYRQNNWTTAGAGYSGASLVKVAATLTPSPSNPTSNWQNVPGAQGFLEQLLQSGSSREEVYIKASVGSSVAGDILYFNLTDTVAGQLNEPGTVGFDWVDCIYANTPYMTEFEYKMRGGLFFDRGYTTLEPNLYTLQVRSAANGTIYIGNVGGQSFQTTFSVREFACF